MLMGLASRGEWGPIPTSIIQKLARAARSHREAMYCIIGIEIGRGGREMRS